MDEAMKVVEEMSLFKKVSSRLAKDRGNVHQRGCRHQYSKPGEFK